MGLSKTELFYIEHMLDMLGDHLSRAGCNDYPVTDSIENRRLVVLMQLDNTRGKYDADEWDLENRLSATEDGYLFVMDTELCGYLQRRVQDELKQHN